MPRIPREVRAWLYGIALAAGPILAIYGIATTEEVAAWLAVAAAILVPSGLALGNLTPADAEPKRAKKQQ